MRAILAKGGNTAIALHHALKLEFKLANHAFTSPSNILKQHFAISLMRYNYGIHENWRQILVGQLVTILSLFSRLHYISVKSQLYRLADIDTAFR